MYNIRSLLTPSQYARYKQVLRRRRTRPGSRIVCGGLADQMFTLKAIIVRRQDDDNSDALKNGMVTGTFESEMDALAHATNFIGRVNPIIAVDRADLGLGRREYVFFGEASVKIGHMFLSE